MDSNQNNDLPGFFARLKQHHIYRVAAWYGASIAVLIQIVARAFPYFGWAAAVPAVIIVLIAGFPVAIVLAWLLVKPMDPIAQTVWQRRHWKLGAMVVPVVIAAVVISGIYAFHYAERRGASVAATLAATQSLAESKTGVIAAPSAATVILAKSVAALPFENLSTDKANAYFADGMQDMILTKLAEIGDLKVIARSSTAKYISHPEDLKAIGEQLGVATILEGSVQKAGNQVLINVQLIDASTDAHIWAESFQRNLDNIFGVEGEVAQKVADALNAKLSASESRAVASIPTTNAQAYTAYLKAQYEMGQFAGGDGDPSHLHAAVRYFKQATADDPKFALAWAELSVADSVFLAVGIASDDTRDALANARKALALQPDLGRAHYALGTAMYFSHAGHADDVIRELQTAARLTPSDFYPHALLAIIYMNRGDWTQAGAEIARSLQVDPQGSFDYWISATIDGAIGHYAEAQQMLERCLAIKPGNLLCRRDLGNTFVMAHGDLESARVQYGRLSTGLAYNKYRSLADTWWLARDYARALDAASCMPQAESGKSAIGYAGIRELMIGRIALATGDRVSGRRALKQARTEALAALQAHPDESDIEITLSQVEMWSEHRDAALRAAGKALSLAATSVAQSLDTSRAQVNRAKVMAHFDDAAGATVILDKLLATPGNGLAISPALLKLDPIWDPIRHDPRFQILLTKYTQEEPSQVSNADAPTNGKIPVMHAD